MFYKTSITVLFFFLWSVPNIKAVHDAVPFFHKVKAENGDGVYSLLRRYHLADHACNVNQFYKLNQLPKTKARLIKGRLYKLPVWIYEYNGKSIRSTIDNDNWDLAVRIQKYNNRLTKEKIRRSTYTKSNILWVPYHELKCSSDKSLSNINPPKTTKKENLQTEVKEEQPTPRYSKTVNLANKKGGNRIYPIFGKKHEHIPLIDNSLKNQVFYIVGGHGGPDSGAVGKYGNRELCEDEYAYDVALRLARNLIAHGAIAYVIIRDPDDGIRDDSYLKCDYDELTWKDQKTFRGQKSRLTQRSDAINKLYGSYYRLGIKQQKLIALHIDARSRKQRADVFFYYKKGSKSGKKLARNIHSTFKSKYQQYQKGRGYTGTISYRDLHMLRETKPSAVYVELGNIKNPADQQRFIQVKNRQYLADWLFEGLTK